MDEITAEQAQAAMNLVNDAESFAPLVTLIPSVPDGLKAALREAHEASGCNARNEGLWCCVDILLHDPAMYEPSKVDAARQLLAQWRERRPASAWPPEAARAASEI